MTIKELLAAKAKIEWTDKLDDATNAYMKGGEDRRDPGLFAEIISRLPDEHKRQIAEGLLGSTAGPRKGI